jgi:hypothetical protein
MASTGTVIRYGYTADSLADVPVAAFEAELHDALWLRWPGAGIDITQGSDRVWGVIGDTEEIAESDIRAVAQDVFDRLCKTLVD